MSLIVVSSRFFYDIAAFSDAAAFRVYIDFMQIKLTIGEDRRVFGRLLKLLVLLLFFNGLIPASGRIFYAGF